MTTLPALAGIVTGSSPVGTTENDCTTAPCWFNWSMRDESAMVCQRRVTTPPGAACRLLAPKKIICGTLDVGEAGGVSVAVGVGVLVKVGVIVNVGVMVNVAVIVDVCVTLGVNVGVMVGVWVSVGDS